MSVPTHNLYDFVHQVTKKQFFMLYFYPWGSRALTDVVHYQIDEDWKDGPGGIPLSKRNDMNLLPTHTSNLIWLHLMQPIIFCHDQEPLNYDFYHDDGPFIKELFDFSLTLKTKRAGIVHSPYIQNLNLRSTCTTSLQRSWILLHSELNSSEVTRYESTGRYVGAYWWSHAVIARDWYRYAEFDTSLQPDDNYQRLFLLYCREFTGSREYRSLFMDKVKSAGLVSSCQTHSFHGRAVGPEASATYDPVDFNQTGISVVLETVFHNRIHLTEKILRPIACGHPFILAAGPGSLKVLHRYGFRTFSPFIDESYDLETDSDKRMDLIMSEMCRIAAMDPESKQHLLNQCRLIAEHNRRRFFSKNFFDSITDELHDNVMAAYDKHQGELDFDLWWKDRKWRHVHRRDSLETAEHTREFSSLLVPYYRKQRTNLV